MSSKTLSKSGIKKVARLARLEESADDKFLEEFGGQLNDIFEYINELKEVDLTGISPLDGVRTTTLIELRSDQIDQDTTRRDKIRQNILNAFPNRQGDLLVLPGIFEE